MVQALSDYCVYTIAHGELLEEAARERRAATFAESKPWVTARKLWQKAQAAGLHMPVLLGDATDCSRLDYWGILTGIQVEDDVTSYSVDEVRRLEAGHSPQELILRSTGKRIAPNFIRPYAICETPVFLKKDRGA